MGPHAATPSRRQNLSLIDREIDWAIKHRLVERYRERNDLDLASARVAQLDLAYHDIRRGRGLFDLLQRKGMVERVTDDGEIELAKDTPPQTTRAKLRGDFIAAAQAAGPRLHRRLGAPQAQRPGAAHRAVQGPVPVGRRARGPADRLAVSGPAATSRRDSGRAARPARPAPPPR